MPLIDYKSSTLRRAPSLQSLSELGHFEITCGPLLQVLDGSHDGPKGAPGKWEVSILVGVDGAELPEEMVKSAVLHLSAAPIGGGLKAITMTAQPELLTTMHDNTFLRYFVSVERAPRELLAEFRIVSCTGGGVGEFLVPAQEQEARFLFTSCNGFHDAAAEAQGTSIAATWRWIQDRHEGVPFHVAVGGGDQIYADEVFEKCPRVRAWAEELRGAVQVEGHAAPAGPLKAAVLAQEFTEQMQKEVDGYYVQKYLDHFGSAYFKVMLRSLPWMNVVNDHDLVDGWGSYAPEIQKSNVVQGIFCHAKRCYLLFQHHTTDKRLEQQARGMVGATEPPPFVGRGPAPREAYSFVRSVGSVAVAGVDTCMERSRSQVASQQSWEDIFERLEELAALPTCKHLLVVLAAPIVYPCLDHLRKVLEALPADSKSQVVRGLVHKVLDRHHLRAPVGTGEVEDDLVDQWGHAGHRAERDALVARLQTFATRHQIRVTIVSGDVHCAALGRITRAKTPCCGAPESCEDLQAPSTITQVISSAVGASPAPEEVVRCLRLAGAMGGEEYAEGAYAQMGQWDADEGGESGQEKAGVMQGLLRGVAAAFPCFAGQGGADNASQERMFIARRNWLEIHVGSDAGLKLQLYTEGTNNSAEEPIPPTVFHKAVLPCVRD